MAEDDNVYQFLKVAIQSKLWKKHGNNPRVSRLLGVASNLSVVGKIILYIREETVKKMERIATQESKKYYALIEGMLNAYLAIPHPAKGKSPFELMFGRKVRLEVLPEISEKPT
ncbi:Hypothetical predicted protein [Paramuricea clavata]|uniref:Uncharacterized protein n=1 Tax=Paramuricea clavata TaxID=317549 RepID=A0A6S7FJS2_PARCT|nr:Hypothetical predicted protein [Paramuricea clavata]